jgi:hypothetical protein
MRDDPTDAVRAFIKLVFDNLSGLAVSSMIYLGYHLGLYAAMQDGEPTDSAELARRTKLHERWVREWLQGQAAARLIEYRGDGRFALSPIACAALGNRESPVYVAGSFAALPQQVNVLEQLRESFVTGIGLPYDALGPQGACGVEHAGAVVPHHACPWSAAARRRHRKPASMPAADIGCGTGIALIEMAGVPALASTAMTFRSTRWRTPSATGAGTVGERLIPRRQNEFLPDEAHSTSSPRSTACMT